MLVYEKIYFETYINNQYNWHKNNVAQICFILERAEFSWNFFSWLMDAPQIHRFPAVHIVETHFLLETLAISEPCSGILERFQHTCSSALPNINIIVQYCFLWSSRKRQNLLNFLLGDVHVWSHGDPHPVNRQTGRMTDRQTLLKILPSHKLHIRVETKLVKGSWKLPSSQNHPRGYLWIHLVIFSVSVLDAYGWCMNINRNGNWMTLVIVWYLLCRQVP